MNIIIDINKAAELSYMSYRGQGMISCNGSSRLLLDYKANHPKNYWQILEYLFGEKGLKFTHFKLEMGSDANTSSGTEPCVKRYENEKANVRRGAGFHLAADVKKINPDVTLDMLWWSEPRWVTDAENVYAARYKWYKDTLDAAYEIYGLKFDFVSANRNERDIDENWIIFLSKALKAEKNSMYDFSKIKIVAADECGTWNISKAMLNNKELLDAIDVVGSHYTSYADEDTKLLAEKYGKEIWFSEGSAPVNYSEFSYRFDEGNSGLSGINGVLDVANRMITMVSQGYMTMYEFQPAVAAYYDGVNYCQKQLINANTPWNGYFTLESGFYMDLHFSQFISKGWKFIPSACHADGKPGGDGHAIVDAKYSFLTACGRDGNISVIITNTTAEPIQYNITINNNKTEKNRLYIWETRGPENGQNFNENYFRKIGTALTKDGSISITAKPYSIITVSTVNVPEIDYANPDAEKNTIMQLPYYEKFAYDKKFLFERGSAPLYTTDQGGAFEIVEKFGEKVLMQKVTLETKADEWGETPLPTTAFGDDRWYNYSVSADVLIPSDNIESDSESFAGIGLRYIFEEDSVGGYALRLLSGGKWTFLVCGEKEITTGYIDNFESSKWHNIKISALYNEIKVYVDNVLRHEFNAEKIGHGAGRAALYSSYDNCCFKNICIEPSESGSYIKAVDDTNKDITYAGPGWEHFTSCSYRNFKRTLSKGKAGDSAEIVFFGTGIILTGVQEKKSSINIEIDAERIFKGYDVPIIGYRRSFYVIGNLPYGNHILKIFINSGELAIDSAQIIQ